MNSPTTSLWYWRGDDRLKAGGSVLQDRRLPDVERVIRIQGRQPHGGKDPILKARQHTATTTPEAPRTQKNQARPARSKLYKRMYWKTG